MIPPFNSSLEHLLVEFFPVLLQVSVNQRYHIFFCDLILLHLLALLTIFPLLGQSCLLKQQQVLIVYKSGNRNIHTQLEPSAHILIDPEYIFKDSPLPRVCNNLILHFHVLSRCSPVHPHQILCVFNTLSKNLSHHFPHHLGDH